MRIALLLWILAFMAAVAAAAPEDYEGSPVRAIQFEPGVQPYGRDYLLEILPIRIGQPLSLPDVRAAIERLYSTGRYAGIDVDARFEDGGVVLHFITRGNFFIGGVSVSRISPPPNQGVLVNATRLELGSLYTDASSKQAVNNLQSVLRNNGFYEASIEPQYEYDAATQQVKLSFVIRTNDRARYTRPLITGNPEQPPDEVVEATHWKGWLGWKKVTGARTQDGVQRVRRIYQKRERLEARVALDKVDWDSDANRVQPTLNIDGGPKITITAVGAKISRGKLKQLVPVFEEQSVDRDLLVEGATNLREYLEGQGYFHAQVDFAAKSVDGVRAAGARRPGETIEYRIVRGDRHKVAVVSIQGNHYFDTNTIRERMYVRPASFIQFRYGRFSDTFLQHDVDAIGALYHSNGFRDVEIKPSVVHGFHGKENLIAVHVDINEGPQWLVASLEFEGPSAQNREAILNLIQSQNGQPFSDVTAAIDRDNILDYYYNQGYAGATFAWTFTPAKQPNQVNMKYVVQEGDRRFLRNFLISGLETTSPDLVNQRLMLDHGDPISRSSLLETQKRLYDLGVFARVDMALQNPQGDERDKYVLLDVEEAHKYTITTGLGAEVAKIGGCRSCLDAPAGQAGFSPRASFGVTRRNFLGEGHIVSFQSRASNLDQRAVLSYEAPQFRGSADVSLLFSGLFDDSTDVRTFSSKRREGSVQVGQKLSKASTLLYRFSFRRVSVSDLIVSPELIPLYSQPARIGIAEANYIQDRRDDPSDAHHGVFNTFDGGLASKVFGSQADFTHFLGHNATYYPIGLGSRYVLARSLTLGWLQPLRAGTNIPLPERFFGGGAQSHRGFPENQAGPRDPETGFPVGGSALLVNQTELRLPLLGDNMGGVLFWDAGNVYSRAQAVSFRVSQRGLNDFDYMVHAVGFGVRYRTPVGPVRLDLAYSINPPTFYGFKGTIEDLIACSGAHPPTTGCVQTVQQISHFQFHFSLGQAF
jgi:outer membrane protein insertion porin family